MAYHLTAAFFALLLPVFLLISSLVVRRGRSALYLSLTATLFGNDSGLPQLEIVGAKYDVRRDTERRSAQQHRLRGLLPPSALLAAVCFYGCEILFVPIHWLLQSDGQLALPGWNMALHPAFFWTGEAEGAVDATVAVAAMAFLGAYVAAARILVRQVISYELDGISYLRATLLIVLGVSVALVAYRALGTGVDRIASAAGAALSPTLAAPPSQPGGDGSAEGPSWWLGAAFLLGYSPEIGLAWISRRLQLSLAKRVSPDAFDQLSVTPVEVIDGIDSDIAYRLDLNNIRDVQNLATANPIELYVETPFGLYEVFDWILQAQLCTAMGGRVYKALKKHGVRTIFDLERAVLTDPSPPEGYLKAIGAVLFADADAAFLKQIGGLDNIDPQVVRSVVTTAVDDVHIHRLRALYRRIYWRTQGANEPAWLYRTDGLPGDPPPPAQPA